MTNLISGKEALIALANGEEVQHFNKKMATLGNLVKDEDWGCCDELTISDFNSDLWAFRIKYRTVNLNGIEVPVPFEPKFKDVFYYLDGAYAEGFSWRKMHDDTPPWFFENPLWRTEDEIKQVVAALRQVFGGVVKSFGEVS